jgi:hypothetical protein
VKAARLALVSCAVGCTTSDAHWEAFAAECPTILEGPLDLVGGGPPPYDEACARRIGADLGVDWADFPAASLPGNMYGAPIERIVTGAWMLAVNDVGTVGEVLNDPLVPPSFATELSDLAEALALDPDAASGSLLYEYAANAVVSVGPVAGWRSSSFTSWDDRLHVPEQSTSANPWYWATVVLHESGHHAGRHHVACADPERVTNESVDATWDGATGMAAWFLLRSLARVTDDVTHAHIADTLTDTAFQLCSSAADVPVEIEPWR